VTSAASCLPRRGRAAGGFRYLRAGDRQCIPFPPLDKNEILAAGREAGAVLTVEEHNVTGGLGSAVAETLAYAGVATRFARHGVPDEHVILGPPAALYAHYRLDAAGMESVARQLLAREGAQP
jgi:transketolase C-terminal domain/subunit